MTVYQVGDRVRLLKEWATVARGTAGTVLEVEPAHDDLDIDWLVVEWDIPSYENAPYVNEVELVEAVEQPNMVNHPAHYLAHPSGVECIAITEHMNFCLGNAVKYLWRAGLKGEALEDLRKAQFYIDREIKRLECVSVTPTPERTVQGVTTTN